jgi:mRNA interferase YafQ
MKQIYRTSRFKKDVKRLKNQGKDLSTFKQVIRQLAEGVELEEKYRDHKLIGEFKGKRECHIEPDWLLIYESGEDDLILVRTGSHSELFE